MQTYHLVIDTTTIFLNKLKAIISIVYFLIASGKKGRIKEFDNMVRKIQTEYFYIELSTLNNQPTILLENFVDFYFGY